MHANVTFLDMPEAAEKIMQRDPARA